MHPKTVSTYHAPTTCQPSAISKKSELFFPRLLIFPVPGRFFRIHELEALTVENGMNRENGCIKRDKGTVCSGTELEVHVDKIEAQPLLPGLLG